MQRPSLTTTLAGTFSLITLLTLYFVGSYLYAAVYNCDDMNNCTRGIDWWRHIWQVAVAAILVVIASGLTGRRRTA